MEAICWHNAFLFSGIPYKFITTSGNFSANSVPLTTITGGKCPTISSRSFSSFPSFSSSPSSSPPSMTSRNYETIRCKTTVPYNMSLCIEVNNTRNTIRDIHIMFNLPTSWFYDVGEKLSMNVPYATDTEALLIMSHAKKVNKHTSCPVMFAGWPLIHSLHMIFSNFRHGQDILSSTSSIILSGGK